MLQEISRLEESELSCRRAIALGPDLAEAHSYLGNTLYKLGRLEEAEASYKEALALQPDFTEVHNNLGLMLQELGRLEEAEICFDKAIALKPDYTGAYINLALTLRKLNRLEEAEASYKGAIAIKPDCAESHSSLGVTLYELGRLEEAEAIFRQAIVLQSDFSEAHNNLGNTLRGLGRLEEAEACYRQTIALQSAPAEAHYNLGMTLQALGRGEEAGKSYKNAIKVKPDYLEAAHLLASLTGETTSSAPRVYVENLFDDYASKFDHSLVDKLEYKTPALVIEVILKNHSEGMLGSILDLGCGTGLAGSGIKEYCMNLEGIDLSNKMLDEAREKKIYDRLTHADIVDYLSLEDLNYDYFISTDVFVYFGDLSDVFRLIKSRNRKKGKLVFSTEHTDKNGFFLEKSGRYSHSKKYIESLCEKFNYTLSYFETVSLRKEKGQFLTGGLYLLDF